MKRGEKKKGRTGGERGILKGNSYSFLGTTTGAKMANTLKKESNEREKTLGENLRTTTNADLLHVKGGSFHHTRPQTKIAVGVRKSWEKKGGGRERGKKKRKTPWNRLGLVISKTQHQFRR